MPKAASTLTDRQRKRALKAAIEAVEKDPKAVNGYQRGFDPPNVLLKPEDAGDVFAVLYTTYRPRNEAGVRAYGGQAVLAIGVTRANAAACVEFLGPHALAARIGDEVVSPSELAEKGN